MNIYQAITFLLKRKNIYLLINSTGVGYGCYSSAIVVANSTEKARLIHPRGYIYNAPLDNIEYPWKGYSEAWHDSWCLPADVVVSLIGVATSNVYTDVVINWETRKYEVCCFPTELNSVICFNNVGS